MDGADVPHVPARSARRASGAGPWRAERDSTRIWAEEAADAEGRPAHRRAMAAVRVRRELVSVALPRERRRTDVSKEKRGARNPDAAFFMERVESGNVLRKHHDVA